MDSDTATNQEQQQDEPTLFDEKKLEQEADKVVPIKRRRTRAAKPPVEVDPNAPPAPVLYPQWNPDGSPKLGEDGKQLKLETKMPRPRRKLVDESGNPVTRVTSFPTDHIIRRTEAACTFNPRPTSKRGQMFAAATDGKTVGEFFAEMGGPREARTFLVWFVNSPRVITVTAPSTE